MDLALAIFNIGAGLGVLAAGVALAYLVWQAAPLIRESRALASDLRRLAQTVEAEGRPILATTRELTSNVEVLSEDVAVKLDRLTDLMNALQQGIDGGRITVAAGRAADDPHPEPERWSDPEPEWAAESQPAGLASEPVESWETREEPSGS